MAQVDVAVGLRRSADAKQDDIGGVQALRGERAGFESSLCDIFLDQFLQAGFKKRRLGLLDGMDFIDVAIHAVHVVPELRKAGCAHATDISQAHHDDILLAHFVARSYCTRGEFIMEPWFRIASAGPPILWS